MGGNFSTVSSSIPTRLSDSPPVPTQPNPEEKMPSQTPQLEQSPDPKTPKDPQPEQPPEEESPNEEAKGEVEDDDDEEGEGECGFCLFMKAGGCKDIFVGWENCIKEAEEKKEDIVEKCFEATSALRKCMEAHADYYEPILRAEKTAEEQAIIELENEKENENSGSQEDDSKGMLNKADG